MAEFPKGLSYELEIWTPDRAENAQLAETLSGLQERGIVAARGLTPELAWSLGVVSNQKHIVEFCEGEPGRFSTENRAREWQAKGREFFSFHEVAGFEGAPLSDRGLANIQEADLMLRAYGFAGPKKNDHIPGADITTAFRATEMGQGRRLATPLVEFVVGATIQRHGLDPEIVSLETWESNDDVVSLYKRNGFTQVGKAWGTRGTLRVPGVMIHGHQVRTDPENENRRIVRDRRLFMRYDPNHRYNIYSK